MNNKIDFLRQYHKDIQIIQDNIEEIKDIPRDWKEILCAKTPMEKSKKVLTLWKNYVGRELSHTIMYMEENLMDIELVKYKDKYSLLYSIKAPDNLILYYEGKNPLDRIIPRELLDYWDGFPKSLKCFYENVHDGFFYYASGSMGLIPLQEFVIFDNEDWGILDEIDGPLQLCLKSTFGVFASGMGGYVALDLQNCENDNSTLWFSDQQPRYNINFWDVVDEWIVIGFQT